MHHPVDNELKESLERAAGFLRRSRRVAALTGAKVTKADAAKAVAAAKG